LQAFLVKSFFSTENSTTFASTNITKESDCFKIIILVMKKGIHPDNYRLVVFKDISNDSTFLTRSTAPTKDTIVFEDGNEYPLLKVEISSTSHPFYTGKMSFVDTAGRIDKFNKKFSKFAKFQQK
jgi:large subunit ribosomal protein L31